MQAELTTIEAEIHGIVERYQEHLAALDVELQAELGPFRQPIETLRLAITEMAAEFDPGYLIVRSLNWPRSMSPIGSLIAAATILSRWLLQSAEVW